VQKHRSFKNNIIYISLILLSIVIAIVVWSASKSYHASLAQERFDTAANEYVYKIQKHILKYERVLQSGVGFFHGSDSVTRKEWHDFVQALDLEHNYQGIEGLGFAKMIKPNEVEQVERQMREDGFESFSLKPTGKREQYSSILYLEPMHVRNIEAIGYDMFSEPTRRLAMQRARDTAKAIMSKKVTLVQEIDEDIQAGILIYLPLYKKGMKTETIQERRDALLGFVYAPFRMNTLLDSIAMGTSILNFKIYDSQNTSDASLLYKSSNASSHAPKYKAKKTVEINGRKWHIDFSSTESFHDSTDTFYPMLITSMGLLVHFSLLFIILMLIKSRHLLKVQANELLKLSQALEQSPNSIIITNIDGNIEYVNKVFYTTTGYTKDEIIGKNFHSLHSGTIRTKAYDDMWSSLKKGQIWHGEFVNLRKDGTEYIEGVKASPIFQPNGTVSHYVAIKEDITDKKRSEEHIYRLANFDPLTGLANRFQLEGHTEYAIRAAKRNHEKFSVIFLDLDHFKDINDNLGHDAGDALLIELSKRFKSILREVDTVSRLGGDEFVFILPNSNADGALRIAKKLLEIINTPHIYQGNELLVTASIGIAIYPIDGLDQQTLFKNADTAMYEAKNSGRNRYRFFSKKS